MLSRGVCSLKFATFDLMRVWAAFTGLALAVWFFVQLALGNSTSELIPMLAVAIGGFELVLFAQDFMRARRENG
jgi:hypothetical protein